MRGLITLVFVFILSPSLRAIENSTLKSCYPENLISEHLEDRGQKIVFPDGREFQIIGHYHGSREDQHFLSDLLSVSSVQSSFVKTHAEVILERNRRAINEFSQDIQYTVRELNQTVDKSVRLWSESTPKFTTDHYSYLHQAKTLRRESLDKLQSEFLLASANPAIYLKLFHELPDFVNIDGVETKTKEIEELMQKADWMSQEAEKLAQEHNINQALPADLKKNISEMSKEWNDALIRGDRSFLDSFSLAEVHQIVSNSAGSGPFKAALNLKFASVLLNYRVYARRNALNVIKLISSTDDLNILYIGSSHLAPMMNLLKAECLRSNRQTISSTSSAPLSTH